MTSSTSLLDTNITRSTAIFFIASLTFAFSLLYFLPSAGKNCIVAHPHSSLPSKIRIEPRAANHHSTSKGHSMANPFCHLELDTTDPTKAKAFYSALFDWKISDNEMGGGMVYSTFKPTDDSPGGGMMQHPVPGAPSAWLAYVLVDDVTAANKKAVSLGAKIAVDKQEVPNMGWFSVIIDPTGAHLGLWQVNPAAPRP
jgi:hypothetical protein